MATRSHRSASPVRRPATKHRQARLRAEALEDRRLLAAFTYSGAALSVVLDAATTLSVASGGNGAYVLSLSDSDTFVGTDTTGLTGNGTPTLTITGELTLTSIDVRNSVDATAVEFTGSSGNYVADVTVKLARVAAGAVPAVRFKGTTAFADSKFLAVTAPTVSLASATVSTVTGPLTLSGDTGAAVTSPLVGLKISNSTVSTAGGLL